MFKFFKALAIFCILFGNIAFASGPNGIQDAVGSKSGKNIRVSSLTSGIPVPSLSNDELRKLEPVSIRLDTNGSFIVPSIPKFGTTYAGKVAGLGTRQEVVMFSVDPKLQTFVEKIISTVRSAHVAVVAMEPDSGRILAMADRSKSLSHLSLHAGFPAASLFKLVTAAAAMDKGLIYPNSLVKFRGGTYSLDRWNYIPDSRRDRRVMSLSEALGRSCNPVFGRVGLKLLNPAALRWYASTFGFNADLKFDLPLASSTASIPSDDFGLSRTAAGFGAVKISPIHAATLMSGIASEGLLPRPSIVDRIFSASGDLIYENKPEKLRRLTRPETSKSLLRMMESTTTIGTSRKEFMYRHKPVLPGISVAAKTGTLRGEDAKGLNNWFIAAAPIANPKIAVSVIVVDPKGISTKASRLGRLLIQQYLKS